MNSSWKLTPGFSLHAKREPRHTHEEHKDMNRVTATLIKSRIQDSKIFDIRDFESDVRSVEDGFKIQKQIVKSRVLGDVKGYKVGPAKVADYSKWGLKHPGSGPVFTVLSGTQRRPAMFFSENLQVIECEVGMIIGKHILPRSKPYSKQEVFDHVGKIACTFEFVGSRLGFEGAKPAHHVADCAKNVAVIVGDTRSARTLNPNDLPNLNVSISKNDKVIGTGFGHSGSYRSSPLESMAWIVNNLSSQGVALREGDVVVTGACTLTKDIEYGATYTAEFQGIGSVSCRLVRNNSKL
jgi:2-keto-4-pentenoate hydratase